MPFYNKTGLHIRIGVNFNSGGDIMAKSVGIGLDIGTSSVKIVELVRDKASIKISKFGIQPFSTNALTGGVITNSSEVARVIRELFQMTKIKPKKAVVAIAGQSVIVRHIKMPFMTKDELANAIRWEAERYIPFAIDEVNMDFEIIEEDKDQNTIEVMLVCAHNDILHSHLRALDEADIQPLAMDIQPFALMRAMGMEQTKIEGSVAIVDIGAGTTDLTIVKDGIPRFTRIIPIAGTHMTTTVSDQLLISFAEAEELKIRCADALYDFSGSEESDAYKVNFALQSSLKELVMELRRSFDYYRLQQRNEEIKEVYISGGGSKMKNLIPFMKNELEIKVNKGVNGIGITTRTGDDFVEEFPIYTVAIGLALREVLDA